MLANSESPLLGKIGGLTTIVHSLSALNESLVDSKLTTEEISELPQGVTIPYFDFVERTNHVRSICRLWLLAFESKDTSWINAEILYGHWATIKGYFASAGELRTALIQAGATDVEHADTLLATKESAMRKQVIDVMAAKVKIQAVSAAIDQAIAAGAISEANFSVPDFINAVNSK